MSCRCKNAACVTFELIPCDKLCDSFAVIIGPPLSLYELISGLSACRGENSLPPRRCSVNFFKSFLPVLAI